MHVSMIGFDDGTERERLLDQKAVSVINPNLTSCADSTIAMRERAMPTYAATAASKRPNWTSHPVKRFTCCASQIRTDFQIAMSFARR